MFKLRVFIFFSIIFIFTLPFLPVQSIKENDFRFASMDSSIIYGITTTNTTVLSNGEYFVNLNLYIHLGPNVISASLTVFYRIGSNSNSSTLSSLPSSGNRSLILSFVYNRNMGISSFQLTLSYYEIVETGTDTTRHVHYDGVTHDLFTFRPSFGWGLICLLILSTIGITSGFLTRRSIQNK